MQTRTPMADGFSTQGGFNRLDVQMQQRPLSGWGSLGTLAILVGLPLAISTDTLALLVLPWLLVSVGLVGSAWWAAPSPLRWGSLANLLICLGIPAALSLLPVDREAVGAGSWAAAALLVGALAVRWSHPVEIGISGAALDVRGFEGRLSRCVRRSIPLRNLRWTWKQNGVGTDPPEFVLTLQPHDAPPLQLWALVCARGDQDTLDRALHQARDRARQIAGSGAAEVPEGLEALRGRAGGPPQS